MVAAERLLLLGLGLGLLVLWSFYPLVPAAWLIPPPPLPSSSAPPSLLVPFLSTFLHVLLHSAVVSSSLAMPSLTPVKRLSSTHSRAGAPRIARRFCLHQKRRHGDLHAYESAPCRWRTHAQAASSAAASSSEEEEENEPENSEEEEREQAMLLAELDLTADELAMMEMEGYEDEAGDVSWDEDEKDGAINADLDEQGLVSDEDSRAFAVELAKAMDLVKAEDVRVYDVSRIIYWTSIFVVASGFSQPQLDAMVDRCQKCATARGRETARRPEGRSQWQLLDFGDVVVHVFTPSERDYYGIEQFYEGATELPVEFGQPR